MLYDDDRGGQPFESFSADESPDWPEPGPHPLDAFDAPDRALIVLAHDYWAGRAVSSLADVLTRAGASADLATATYVTASLDQNGLIITEEAIDGVWLRITEAGCARVINLTS